MTQLKKWTFNKSGNDWNVDLEIDEALITGITPPGIGGRPPRLDNTTPNAIILLEAGGVTTKNYSIDFNSLSSTPCGEVGIEEVLHELSFQTSGATVVKGKGIIKPGKCPPPYGIVVPPCDNIQIPMSLAFNITRIECLSTSSTKYSLSLNISNPNYHILKTETTTVKFGGVTFEAIFIHINQGFTPTNQMALISDLELTNQYAIIPWNNTDIRKYNDAFIDNSFQKVASIQIK